MLGSRYLLMIDFVLSFILQNQLRYYLVLVVHILETLQRLINFIAVFLTIRTLRGLLSFFLEN